jgi:hypothetical protein
LSRAALAAAVAAFSAVVVGGSAAERRPVRCPALADAAHLPLRPGGRSLWGDVDGDGSLDVVRIRYSPASPARCGFFVVAETGAGSRAAPVDLPLSKWPHSSAGRVSRLLPEPYVRLLAAIGARGLDIVVTTSHGASIEEHTLYGVGRARLVRVTSFPTFGSLIAQAQVDCAAGPRRSELVFTDATPVGPPGSPTSRFSRRRYRLDGFRLHLIGVARRRASGSAEIRLARRFGIGREPFFSCTIAHS